MDFNYFKSGSVVEIDGNKYLQVENVHQDGSVTLDTLRPYSDEEVSDETSRVKKFNTFVSTYQGE